MSDRGDHRNGPDSGDPRRPDRDGEEQRAQARPGGLPEEDDPTLTEDLPSWATNLTTGADEVEKAEFHDEPEVAAPDEATGEEKEDLSAALDALSALEVDSEDAATTTPHDDGGQERLFVEGEKVDEPPTADEEPEASAGGGYGVASVAAFAALEQPDDGEDLEDWERFAGEPEPEEPEDVAEPSPEPSESQAAEGETRRGRWWPFRRGSEAEPGVKGDPAAAADHRPVEEEIDGDEAAGVEVEDDLVWSTAGRPLVEEEGPVPTPPAGEAGSVDDSEPDEDLWVRGAIERGGPDGTAADPQAGEAEEELDEFIGEVRRRSGTLEHRGLAEEIFRAAEEETEWQAVSAAMPGIDTGVVGFEDVADLVSDEEYHEPAPSDLPARVLTGLVLVGFLFGSLWVGGQAVAAFVAVVVLFGMGEFYITLRQCGSRPLAVFGYMAGIGIMTAAWIHGPVVIPVAVILTAVLTFFLYAFPTQRGDALADGGLTVLGVAWIPGAAAFAFPLFAAADFRGLVFAVVAVTVAMDVGSFAAGSLWGSRPLAPILSPNKSVEGLAGGVIAAVLVAIGVGMLIDPFDIRSGAALGLVVAVMAPLGDLAESMVKRSLGVKDMGTILPGHGGVLDRIDGFLFVVPAAWVLFATLGLLG